MQAIGGSVNMRRRRGKARRGCSETHILASAFPRPDKVGHIYLAASPSPPCDKQSFAYAAICYRPELRAEIVSPRAEAVILGWA